MSTDREKKSRFAAAAIKAVGEERWAMLQRLWKFEDINEPVEPSSEEKKVEMMEATLVDGTRIVYDRLEEGGKVMVVTEEGELPAPDADHTLADGTVISTVGGLIVKIEKVAAVEEPVIEQQMGDDVSKMMDDKINALYEKMKAELMPKAEGEEKKEEEAMKAEFATLKQDHEKLKESFRLVSTILEDIMDPDPEAKPKEGEAKAQTFGKPDKVSKRNQLNAELNKYR